MARILTIATLLSAAWILLSSAQSTSCSSSPTPTYSSPVVASGWRAALVATGFSSPRGVIQDSQGALLLVQQYHGVVHLKLSDAGGTCLSVANETALIDDTTLNHGIALSADGKTLYASSSEAVFAWSYNATDVSVSGRRTLINGMANSDHTTRTLLVSQKLPGILIVSRGSSENVDLDAQLLSSGHSQIKAFDVGKSITSAYDFTTQGVRLGWGLRNSVGLAEEPLTGGIWSVENSADQVTRDGVDVHQDNPGEELNFHGFWNGSTVEQGGNYGYPDCFAVWGNSEPGLQSLMVGDQFVMQPNATLNDTTCATTRIPPRLTFQAHMAPLDIIFTPDGMDAYVTFHGSWNRDDPVGYKVSHIQFSNGQPVAARNSTTATTDIFSNADNSKCPTGCFRPVGLVMDSLGRMFMTSDATGELWVLMKTTASPTTTSATSASATPASSTTKSEAARTGSELAALIGLVYIISWWIL